MQVKAVLFDFDGTLTQPGALDFTKIRLALGCHPDHPILEFIDAQPHAEVKAQLIRQLDMLEMQGAEISRPNLDAEEIVRYLRQQGIAIGIVSRNGRKQIERAMENFEHVTFADFDIVISRETPVQPKPSAQGILLACSYFEIPPSNVLLVGDYIYDIAAGQAAGVSTVFLKNPNTVQRFVIKSDYIIFRLNELKTIIG